MNSAGIRRWLAAVVVGVVAALGAAGAAAGVPVKAPKPLDTQWWFTAWAIENKVWPLSQGAGVTIGLIDTGVEAGLPDFSGAVLPGVDETGGGGDGRRDTNTGTVEGHGTGMASLIVGQGSGTGFLGVSPQAKIMPIVANTASTIEAGIHDAVDGGVGVINISQVVWANQGCPSDMQEAVDYAVQHDVVVVAGAGNDGDEENPSLAPANCRGVLAVGAVDGQLRPWTKTERQPYVTVSAPGVYVGGVLPDGKVHSSPGGTSSAAALTSATVALVRSRFPQLHIREVVQRIMASLRDAGPPGRDDQTGYGVVRPVYALADSIPANTANPVFDAYDKGVLLAPHRTHRPTAGPPVRNPASARAGVTGLVLSGVVTLVFAIAVTLLVLYLVRRAGRRRAPHPPPHYPVPPPYYSGSTMPHGPGSASPKA